MRICYAHDLTTGVALRPEYGAAYGEDAVSESWLLQRMLARMSGRAAIVADRLFGTFHVCHEIVQHGHDVVVRVNNARATKLRKELKKPGEVRVTWTPSASERRKYPELNDDSKVSGRFIWRQIERKGLKPVELLLFTTLENPAESIVALYGLRWHDETDIRYIKSCMDVGELSAKSTEMIEKEIVLAQTAYNLVRHTAALAASRRGIDPRRISFSRVCNFIRIVGPRMGSIDRFAQDDLFERFISSLHQITNADRDRPPQPRKLIYRRRKFPIMTKTRSNEQKTLKYKLEKLN